LQRRNANCDSNLSPIRALFGSTSNPLCLNILSNGAEVAEGEIFFQTLGALFGTGFCATSTHGSGSRGRGVLTRPRPRPRLTKYSLKMSQDQVSRTPCPNISRTKWRCKAQSPLASFITPRSSTQIIHNTSKKKIDLKTKEHIDT